MSTDNITQKEKGTLVCVTDQYKCERIIRAGRAIADLSQTPLYVVSVDGGSGFEKNHDALEHLYAVSAEHNADMTVVYENDVFKALSQTIKDCSALHVVTGVPRATGGLLSQLVQRFPDTLFHQVPEDE